MYENRTQEVITAEMLSDFGANVRTDTGSLAYNAVVKTASELEDVYTDMEGLEDNALPDTMDLMHLIRYGAIRGIVYKYATPAIVRAVFDQEMSIRDRVSCQDYTYYISSEVEEEPLTYLMTCEEEGTGANAVFGEVEPIDYIEGWVGGRIVSIEVLGVEDEDTEVFRARVINSFSSLAFSGNIADYRNYIDGLSIIGGCKPRRRDHSSEYINIFIIDNDYNTPSGTVVDTVQNLIDPIGMQGEGVGKAGINQKVQIIPAFSSYLDVEATLVLDTGYTIEVIQPQAESIIKDILFDLRRRWESNEWNETIVRRVQIEAAFISIDGVLDVRNLYLNGDTQNFSIDWSGIPVLRNVMISI